MRTVLFREDCLFSRLQSHQVTMNPFWSVATASSLIWQNFTNHHAFIIAHFDYIEYLLSFTRIQYYYQITLSVSINLCYFIDLLLSFTRVQYLAQLELLNNRQNWTSQLAHWHVAKQLQYSILQYLSLIHIWRCRRIERCRSRWSPYH